MSLLLYMDVHVPKAITVALRLKGIAVLTAQEDGAEEFTDAELLQRATALQSALFSMDHDLLREASRRQRANEPFAGVIYCHQMNLTIGQIIADLHLIAVAYDPVDIQNLVEYLPL